MTRRGDDLPAAARAPVVRPRRFGFAAVAAVLLAVVVPCVSWVLWTRAGGPRGLPGMAELPPPEQRRVQAALQAGVADAPAWLAELAGAREVVMGSTPAAELALVAPLGTAVVSDRPRLQWRALAGATGYTVAIADENLRPLAASPLLSTTEWVPERSLPRGRTYSWEVTAQGPGGPVTAPRAPAPAARFRVVDAETAARLERVQARHPESHLLLGILYLQAGVRPEARRELGLVPRSDPRAGVARRSLERLGPAKP